MPELITTTARSQSSHWRRHSDPPGLWMIVLVGSLGLHLLVVVAMYSMKVRVSATQARRAPVAVELIEVAPVAKSAVPAKSSITSQSVASIKIPSQTFVASPSTSSDPAGVDLSTPSIRPPIQKQVPPRLTPTPSPQPRKQTVTPPKPPAVSPSPVPSPLPRKRNPLIREEPLPSSAIPSPTPIGPPGNPPLARSTTSVPAPVVGSQSAPPGSAISPTPATPGDDSQLPSVPVATNPAPVNISASIKITAANRDIAERSAQPKVSNRTFVSGEQDCTLNPESARYLGKTVTLFVEVSNTGQVVAVEPVELVDQGAYDELATCMIKQWEFSPAFDKQDDNVFYRPDDLKVEITINLATN